MGHPRRWSVIMIAEVKKLASSDERTGERAAKRLAKKFDPEVIHAVLPLALSSDLGVQSRALMVLTRFLDRANREIWNFMRGRLKRGSRATKLTILFVLEDLPVKAACSTLKRYASIHN